jgi:3-hydroxyisobutyrate dehydrogenase
LENAVSTVGFVGLGDIGSRMVPHVLRANHRVIAFDVMRNRLAAMTALGAVAAESAAAAARDADVVISAVMSADIPAAHLGRLGILAGMRAGAALAMLSTTSPQMLQSIASQMPAGVHLVDAPLIGGVRYAAEAALTVLLAGSDEAMALTEPILALFGNVVHVGPLGSGVAYKLITNVVVMAAEAGLREALDLTDILGCSYKTTLDLLARGPMAASSSGRWIATILGPSAIRRLILMCWCRQAAKRTCRFRQPVDVGFGPPPKPARHLRFSST